MIFETTEFGPPPWSVSLHSKKKSTSEYLFWCFRLSQIEGSIQMDPKIPLMVLPGTIWSFQVLNTVFYLWQPEAPKKVLWSTFFLRVWACICLPFLCSFFAFIENTTRKHTPQSQKSLSWLFLKELPLHIFVVIQSGSQEVKNELQWRNATVNTQMQNLCFKNFHQHFFSPVFYFVIYKNGREFFVPSA